MESKEKMRMDKFLWGIRLFKTRAIATDACENGRVKIDGVNVKPAKAVHVSDMLEVKTEARKWVIKVLALTDRRLPYPEAILCYTDLTPPEELAAIEFQATSFNTGKRQSKVGRPTKKNRRDIGGLLDS